MSVWGVTAKRSAFTAHSKDAFTKKRAARHAFFVVFSIDNVALFIYNSSVRMDTERMERIFHVY